MPHSGAVAEKSCVDVVAVGRATCKDVGQIVVVAFCPCRVGSRGRLGLEIAAPRSATLCSMLQDAQQYGVLGFSALLTCFLLRFSQL